MLFIELRYFLFFAVVLLVHWRLTTNRARKLWLLGASYLFYAAWDWRFVGLLWSTTVMDWTLGGVLARLRAPRARQAVVAISISVNLGILFLFKYWNFFLSGVSHWTLQLILPAGISFYVFESISYAVDIYRGARPARSLTDFALFLAFFPHLIAGPILRPRELLPQLEEERRFSSVEVRPALLLILVGFIKKACIGDTVAITVDKFYASPAAFGAEHAVIATLFWAVQVYCDFSGYTDMALGSAALLGYQLPRNFDAPLLAPTVTEFWRRWHITLSRFLRDYLYIPLGGSRISPARTYVNLMVTMLLAGLWHGAGWNFVLWGGLHGVALAVERLVKWRPRPIIGVPLTFYFFCASLVVFRSHTVADALAALHRFILLGPRSHESVWPELGCFVALALTHWLCRRHPVEKWGRDLPAWGFAATYGAAFAVAFAFVPLGYRPFIYFQF